jgi:hypothetical protein
MGLKLATKIKDAGKVSPEIINENVCIFKVKWPKNSDEQKRIFLNFYEL